jgi:hypothetical protein
VVQLREETIPASDRELDAEETAQALLHWKQLKLVVLAAMMIE